MASEIRKCEKCGGDKKHVNEYVVPFDYDVPLNRRHHVPHRLEGSKKHWICNGCILFRRIWSLMLAINLTVLMPCVVGAFFYYCLKPINSALENASDKLPPFDRHITMPCCCGWPLLMLVVSIVFLFLIIPLIPWSEALQKKEKIGALLSIEVEEKKKPITLSSALMPKKGSTTLTSVLVFMLVGAVLWCAAGVSASLSSFQYVGGPGLESSVEKREIKDEYITPPHILAGGIWAICGAGVGILILLKYTGQQKEDYFTPIPPSLTRLLPFQILLKFVRLKTFAEAKTLNLVSFLSVLGGVLLPLLVLPKLATSEAVIIRPADVRIFAGLATTGFATMFILPLSLWLVATIIINGRQNVSYSDRQKIIGEYFTKENRHIIINFIRGNLIATTGVLMLITFVALLSLLVSVYYYVSHRGILGFKIMIFAVACSLIGSLLMKLRP